MVTALAWPPELNAKILLLKTLHKVVKGMEKSSRYQSGSFLLAG